MKQIYQYRYYGDNHDKNQPTNAAGPKINRATLISGAIFSAKLPILQLGIQALPGTKFYMNNSKEPVIIGSTGIYELDLQGKAEVNALAFDAKSIDVINNMNKSFPEGNGYLIVDIIYDDGKEN